MPKFKPNIMSQSNQTSCLLLNHIKDQQFYSTLSTITLQLAKQAGVEREAIQELASCFLKVKGYSDEPMLTLEKQSNHNDQNINKSCSSFYDSFEKNISTKQQINFLSKMENQLILSRQKQNYTKSLNKYANEKQSELIPLLSISPLTKSAKFKNLLHRKKKNKISTSCNYFKLSPLDLLKNCYQNQNQCYTMMRSFQLLKTMFGHSMDDDRQSNCPLYNVLFDQEEKLIISGGEEGAIKIWSKQTGVLLSSLKGHTDYINKIQVTKCNRYICSSAKDGVRFFKLDDMTTLTGWKSESIIQIVSIYDSINLRSKFMFGDKKNIYILDELKMLSCKSEQRALTKDDFLIFRYSHKVNKQSHILNIQVDISQSNVLLGFQSGDVLLFNFKDLFTVLPIKHQTQPLSNYYNLPVLYNLSRSHFDQIRELKWHHSGDYFVSGGKQGFCLLWEYKQKDKQPFKLQQIQVSKLFNRRKKRAFGCNFICWNCTEEYFVAGFMELVDEDDDDRGNGDVIAYGIQQKQVVFEFSKDMPMKVASVRGMDTHPTYPNIAIICQGTGRILVLDFLLKTILNTFQLRGFHLLHPQFALNPGDCRFSKDGRYFVVSTQFGSVSIFGYDLKSFYQLCPSEQFFENDFTAFTINDKMEPIPIEGDLQIDMNSVKRGKVTNIRGEVYQNQLHNDFIQYWKEHEKKHKINGSEHKNGIMVKDINRKLVKNIEEENITGQNYKQYVQKIKFNVSQADNFNHFYSKNLQQIQSTKQSLLYDQREKQQKVFQKILQDKLLKFRALMPNNSFNRPPQTLPQLTHDDILQKIDAKGRRGGRRLIKAGNNNRLNYPSYKDDNFQYDSQKEEEYNIQLDPQQEDDLELDYNVSNSSDDRPVIRRRGPHGRSSGMQNNSRRSRQQSNNSRYNIRSRSKHQNYNYNDQNGEQQEQRQKRTFKRRSPAQDIEDMLKNNQFRNYDMSKGRKKRKRNRIRQSDDQDFIRQSQQQSEYAGQSDSLGEMRKRHQQRRENNFQQRRRGRPRKNPIPQAREQQQDENIQDEMQQDKKQDQNSNNKGRFEGNHSGRLRKRQINEQEDVDQQQDLYKNYRIQEEESNGAHNLRTRNHYSSHNNNQSSPSYQHDSSIKKKKHLKIDLGQCYRCAVNPATIMCERCQCVCCQSCKSHRGRQTQSGKFNCFTCIYLNSHSTALLDEKKLSETYFRQTNLSQSQTFVPQVDDLVRFFFQGYQQFLYHNVKSLYPKVTDQIQEYLLMPHIFSDMYDQKLLETPLCKVKQIRYFFPYNTGDTSLSTMYKRRTYSSGSERKHIHMLIDLQLVNNNKQDNKQLQKKQEKSNRKVSNHQEEKENEKRNNFWIFYIPGPITLESQNQYIIREQLYQYIQENNLIQKLQVNQTIMIEQQEYQVVEINAMQDSFPQSIWRQIKINRSDSKRLRNMSKQAQKRCNIWNIDKVVPQLPYHYTTPLPILFQKKLLQRIRYVRENIQQYQLYEDYIQFQIYPAYRKKIQVGICLTAIEERIKNNYYRSINQLIRELDQLVQNSIRFNGQENSVTTIGIKIRQQILKGLNVSQQIMKKFDDKKVQEKQGMQENRSNPDTSKQYVIKESRYKQSSFTKQPIRQKRQPKKKELDENFIVPEQQQSQQHKPSRNIRVTTTNDNVHTLRSLRHNPPRNSKPASYLSINGGQKKQQSYTSNARPKRGGNKNIKQNDDEQDQDFRVQQQRQSELDENDNQDSPEIKKHNQYNKSQEDDDYQQEQKGRRSLRRNNKNKPTANVVYQQKHNNSNYLTPNTNLRESSRISRSSRQKASSKSQIAHSTTSSKNKKYDKIIQDYDKQQQVYKNIQNRRNKSRYIDSSYDSNQKGSNVIGSVPGSIHATRRSNRLNQN